MAEPNKGKGEEFFEVELLPGQSDKIMLSKELIRQLETTEVFKKTGHYGLSYLYIQISRKPINLPSEKENITTASLTEPAYLEDNECGPAAWLLRKGVLPPVPQEILVYPVQPDNDPHYHDYPTRRRAAGLPTYPIGYVAKDAPGYPRATLAGLDDTSSIQAGWSGQQGLRRAQAGTPAVAAAGRSPSPNTPNREQQSSPGGATTPSTSGSRMCSPSPMRTPSPYGGTGQCQIAPNLPHDRNGLVDIPGLIEESRKSRSTSSSPNRQPSPRTRFANEDVPRYTRAEGTPTARVRRRDRSSSPRAPRNDTAAAACTTPVSQPTDFSHRILEMTPPPYTPPTPRQQNCPRHHLLRDDSNDMVMNWEGFTDRQLPEFE